MQVEAGESKLLLFQNFFLLLFFPWTIPRGARAPKNKSTEQALLKLREWGANFCLPLLCISDSGPSFRNTFVKQCAKIGVRVEHSSTYNPSNQSAFERGIGNLKHLLKRWGTMNQLQIHELIFCLNSRVQRNETRTPIARFLGKKLGPKSLVQIGPVTAEILLIWTNLARTNVAWTNVTVTFG